MSRNVRRVTRDLSGPDQSWLLHSSRVSAAHKTRGPLRRPPRGIVDKRTTDKARTPDITFDDIDVRIWPDPGLTQWFCRCRPAQWLRKAAADPGTAGRAVGVARAGILSGTVIPYATRFLLLYLS